MKLDNIFNLIRTIITEEDQRGVVKYDPNLEQHITKLLPQLVQIGKETYDEHKNKLLNNNVGTEGGEKLSQILLTKFGTFVKHTLHYPSVYLESENTTGESYNLYITDGRDVVYIYLPFIHDFSSDYEFNTQDIEIIKTDHPQMYLAGFAQPDDFYEQLFESLNYNEDSELYNILLGLRPAFIKAAQEIYDQWEQDEDGYDEVLGTGGICQDIAEAFCEVFNKHNNQRQYSCYDSGEAYDFHVVMYAYIDPEYIITDEDGNKEGELLFEVDLPHYLYESGGGYNWTKKPNVIFTPDMITISDLSTYYENYVGQNNE